MSEGEMAVPTKRNSGEGAGTSTISLAMSDSESELDFHQTNTTRCRRVYTDAHK